MYVQTTDLKENACPSFKQLSLLLWDFVCEAVCLTGTLNLVYLSYFDAKGYTHVLRAIPTLD